MSALELDPSKVDHLVDRHGVRWFPTESGGFARKGEEREPLIARIEGPVLVVWKASAPEQEPQAFGQPAAQLWQENNRMTGELTRERMQAQELRQQVYHLERENKRLMKELAGKREAMARVLDAYPTSPMEVQANGLGDVVRAALHDAKGGNR